MTHQSAERELGFESKYLLKNFQRRIPLRSKGEVRTFCTAGMTGTVGRTGATRPLQIWNNWQIKLSSFFDEFLLLSTKGDFNSIF